MSKKISDLLSSTDNELFDSVKKEYAKLSDIDRKDVLDTTNSIVDTFGKLLGIENPEKYHLTDDMLNECKTKCQDTVNKAKDTATKISKSDVVKEANNFIKENLNKLGIKNTEKFMVSEDDVYIPIATPDETVACVVARKDGCFNESCDSCDGQCKNPDCEVENCICKEDDADNVVDAPAKVNTPRLELNLAAAKKTNTNKTHTHHKSDNLAPEIKSPASTVKISYDANGNKVEGANPYAESDNVKNGFVKQSLTDIKNRLMNEAKTSEDDNNKLTVKVFKETLVSKVTGILEDSVTHSYKVHSKTPKSPAAVEVTLEDISSSIRNNIYILSEIENELKTLYEFPEVHINVVDTDDPELVNLIVFMVLE